MLGLRFFNIVVLLALVTKTVGENEHRRSDDIDPLQNTVNIMAQDISFLKSELTPEKQRITDLEAANNRRVAFSAACVEGEHIPASGTAIINLNVVITNVGNAYNPHTGVFTAPYDGYYYFIVNIDVSPDYEVIDVRRNDKQIFAADKDDKVRTHVSGSAITRLDAGDAVALHHKSRDVGYVECGLDSTFTGFLIW